MSFGSRAEKLHGHGHGHDYDYDHGHDLRLHPAGNGFVAPKAKRHRWLRPDPAPWRGIRVSPPELGEVVPPLPPKVPPVLFVVEELDEHAANATAADRTNARLHWI